MYFMLEGEGNINRDNRCIGNTTGINMNLVMAFSCCGEDMMALYLINGDEVVLHNKVDIGKMKAYFEKNATK